MFESGRSLAVSRQNVGQDLAWSLGVVSKITQFLLQLENTPEGLFLEPQQPTVETEAILKKLLEEPNTEQLSNVDPLLVGKALLRMLKEPSEPLLSFQAYDSFLMLQYIQKEKDKVDISRLLFRSLPARPKALVYQLFSLLTKITNPNPQLKVPYASVFGPLILRPQKRVYYMTNDSETIKDITLFLLNNFSKLTDSEEKQGSASPSLPDRSLKLRSGSIASLKTKKSNVGGASQSSPSICNPFIVDLAATTTDQ